MFVISPGKKMSELSEEVSSSSSSLASLLSSGGEDDDLVLLVPKEEEEEEVPSPPDYSSVLLDELLESAKKYPGKRVKTVGLVTCKCCNYILVQRTSFSFVSVTEHFVKFFTELLAKHFPLIFPLQACSPPPYNLP